LTFPVCVEKNIAAADCCPPAGRAPPRRCPCISEDDDPVTTAAAARDGHNPLASAPEREPADRKKEDSMIAIEVFQVGVECNRNRIHGRCFATENALGV
jgi:hypothetical protein